MEGSASTVSTAGLEGAGRVFCGKQTNIYIYIYISCIFFFRIKQVAFTYIYILGADVLGLVIHVPIILAGNDIGVVGHTLNVSWPMS